MSEKLEPPLAAEVHVTPVSEGVFELLAVSRVARRITSPVLGVELRVIVYDVPETT
jgi:hypothetical protein